jgi:hypothetical protein
MGSDGVLRHVHTTVDIGEASAGLEREHRETAVLLEPGVTKDKATGVSTEAGTSAFII